MKVYSCQDNDLCHNFELIEELQKRNADLLAACKAYQRARWVWDGGEAMGAAERLGDAAIAATEDTP